MILQIPVSSWILVGLCFQIGESAGGLVRQKEAMIDDIVDSPSWPKTSFENGHDSFVAPEIGNILTLIDSTLVIFFLVRGTLDFAGGLSHFNTHRIHVWNIYMKGETWLPLQGEMAR